MKETEIIYGRNALSEALKSGLALDTLYVQSGLKGLEWAVFAAREKGAVVKNVSSQKLDSLTDNARHGGVAATVCAMPYAELDELLDLAAEKSQSPFFIMADEIEDPHNLGAIIRTAEAAGAHGVIIPKRRSAQLSGTVANTSAGALSWIKVCRVTNLVDTIKELKKHNIWIYGADIQGQPYRQTDFSGGVCLIIGSEGKGLGRLVRENCDIIVSIDMHGKINSLNASVSAGILMYEVVRQKL
ncbi:MAG: 23S rRNA (guanosine(2251)-2'-O)-methyltransferase RlmB [Oscillospiraceae bacterium]|nr:23S rRNA (guanosine(2251)-2'-O)-methyltransferase RlmB [Oscillospiraceae bacterium]